MTYTVIWTPTALQMLAAVWLAATNRNAVNNAANTIDLVLAAAPKTTGVVEFDTVREHSIPPLGFEFEVEDAARQVFVLTVWDTATGRPNPTGN
jgi:hypothetical protein